MKTKIIVILLMMLLIFTVLPVIGINAEKKDIKNESIIDQQSIYRRPPAIINEIEKPVKSINMVGTPFYGYVCDDPLYELIIGPCSFMPTYPSQILPLAHTVSNDFLSGGTWVKGVWYGCEYSAGPGDPYIWIIDETNGAMTYFGNYDPGGTGLSLNGLAYEIFSNRMYGCSRTHLYEISLTNGAASMIGPMGNPGGAMIGIAFDGDGELWGVDIVTDSLYQIDRDTGEATLIGPLNIDLLFAQDMAFDIDTGILYLAAYTIAPSYEGGLYTCDTITGATTKIDSFENGAQISCFAVPCTIPPSTPIITGPTVGDAGTRYCWTICSTDPDTYELYYYINLSEDKITETICWPSGVPLEIYHTYHDPGFYKIGAMAVECPYGPQWSDWGELVVMIPRNRINCNSLFMRFLERFPILEKILGYIL